MIRKCENCWTQYNDETVNHCPACQPNKKKKRRGKSGKFGDITEYRRKQVTEKKQAVNSYRRAEVSRYEREKGKQVYNKF